MFAKNIYQNDLQFYENYERYWMDEALKTIDEEYRQNCLVKADYCASKILELWDKKCATQ